MFKAEILAIGDELLIGQVLNTNAQWLAQELNSIGISIKQMTTISDDKESILDAINQGFDRVDFIFITGGLGPTKDDITKHALCQYFDSKLVLNQEKLDLLKSIFAQRGLVFNDLNIDQAMLPDKCLVINNELGTASGMWFVNEAGKVLISMPGVPYEMKGMMRKVILPKISQEFVGKPIMHRTLRTFGTGESVIAQHIEHWENKLPEGFKLAYLPNVGQVRLRLSGTNTSLQVLEQLMDAEIEELKKLVSDCMYGEGEEELEHVIAKVLIQNNQTLATAESCTGGFLAHKITSVAGSSKFYMGSVIAYGNQIKTQELGVSAQTLAQYGAVSERTVVEMANGIRAKYKTDFALSTSGIAGPDGGTEDKTVGTVWIALASKEKTIAKKLQLGKDRGRNIQLASMFALDLLRRNIL